MGIMRIFSDRRYLAEKQPHVHILYPFWGNDGEAPTLSNWGLDRYADMGHRFFQMVPLENADIAVLPAEWRNTCADAKARNLAIEFADLAKRAGKKVAIFFIGDSDEAVPIDNAIVFRTSYNRSQRRPNEFAMPYWSANSWDDFSAIYFNSGLTSRPKSEKPVVGFCGVAYSPRGGLGNFKIWCLKGRPSFAIYELGLLFSFYRSRLFGIKTGGLYRGQFLRTDVMRVLSRSKLIDSNFVVRDRFLGGAVRGFDGINMDLDVNLFKKVRQDYVRNMLDSDYILCARGSGNFSIRFYEAMSCGRVPLFIDTDCGLPYDWLINWRNQFMWVEERDVSNIAKQLVTFHSALSPDDFQNLQVNCRKLWEDWLSPVGFFANFYRHFQLQ